MNQRDEFKYKKLDAQKAQPLLIKWIILILVCLFSTGFIGFLVWKLFYIIRNPIGANCNWYWIWYKIFSNK